jgi:hypothetical protein
MDSALYRFVTYSFTRLPWVRVLFRYFGLNGVC